MPYMSLRSQLLIPIGVGFMALGLVFAALIAGFWLLDAPSSGRWVALGLGAVCAVVIAWAIVRLSIRTLVEPVQALAGQEHDFAEPIEGLPHELAELQTRLRQPRLQPTDGGAEPTHTDIPQIQNREYAPLIQEILAQQNGSISDLPVGTQIMQQAEHELDETQVLPIYQPSPAGEP